MENITSNGVYVAELLRKLDLIAIQEHWLWTYEKSVIEKFAESNDCHCFIKCTDEYEQTSINQRMRGWGGCGLIWKKELSEVIEVKLDGSERICVIILNSKPKSYCIISVYMPTTGKKQYDICYEKCIDEIAEIMEKYDAYSIIILGDMNASLNRKCETSRDRLFKKALIDLNLVTPCGYPQDSTFFHHNDVDRSQLDYILVKADNKDMVYNIEVKRVSGVNLSTHVPVEGSIDFGGVIYGTDIELSNSVDPACNVKPRIKWHKCDLKEYQKLVDTELCKHDFQNGTLDKHLECISSILINSAEQVTNAAERLRGVRKKKVNHKNWPKHILDLCRKSKQAYWEYKHCQGTKNDQDKCSELWLICKRAKRDLRRAQRQLEASRKYKLYSEIMSAHSNDQKLFHKLINIQRNGSNRKLSKLIIDDVHLETNSDIRQGWVDYFEQLSQASQNESFSEQYKQFILNKIQMIDQLTEKMRSNDQQPFCNEEDIMNIINGLKFGKAPDELSLTSEHLRYGGSKLVQVLHVIFEKIWNECYIPKCFKSGVITPIYKKNNKPLEDPNSYRRITVCSIIGKVFESVFMSKISHVLDVQQNSLQRGFTKNVSPTNAALLLTEAINEARDQGNLLFAAFIDASKAFDVVWHNSLLCKLYESGITGCSWQLVHQWYQNLESKVKWENQLSCSFREEQGVRQGGILSPLLYKAFINPLLDWFKEKNVGLKTLYILVPQHVLMILCYWQKMLMTYK